MSVQTDDFSPEFQALIQQVETALVLAAVDARRLAEQSGTRTVALDNPLRMPSSREREEIYRAAERLRSKQSGPAQLPATPAPWENE
ncbi:MAG: hypothetical protein LBU06_10720 [Desulfovibrio sp.]|jgi:hypothetical protein|nr:hypothetical protein [Desulfovibrio sp.]